MKEASFSRAFPVDISVENCDEPGLRCSRAELCGRWVRGAIQIKETLSGRDATFELGGAACTKCDFQYNGSHLGPISERTGLRVDTPPEELVTTSLMTEAQHAIVLKIAEIDQSDNSKTF